MGFTAGGIQCGIIVYVSEISNDGLRGRLCSLTPVARNFGILLSYIVCSIIDHDYDVTPSIFIYFPIIYMVCLFYLPNTPQYHLSEGNFEVSAVFFFHFKFNAN